jgi:hypothetical protein
MAEARLATDVEKAEPLGQVVPELLLVAARGAGRWLSADGIE